MQRAESPEHRKLERWNAMSGDAACESLLPCCGSRAWATEMVARRPFRDAGELAAAADAVWRNLRAEDWDEAFAAHPRIGERQAVGTTTERSLAWSAEEQRGTDDNTDMNQRLAEGNRAYEDRFGRIFLICASGRTKREMLALLQERLKHDAAQELHVAAEQQRQITALRLRRWLEEE